MVIKSSAAARSPGVIDVVSRAMAVLADPALVGTAADEQVVAGLRHVLTLTPERVRGQELRAAAAIRTACAHLAAENLEDAFIALQTAHDHLLAPHGRR